MTWQELFDFIFARMLVDNSFLTDTVTVYDRTRGEYYPADMIEFEDGDDILPPNSIFLEIQT